MKKSKIIPVVALTTLLLTGCPATNNDQPSSGNLLKDALAKLPVGTVKKKQADALFKSNVLSSSDKDVTEASYQEDLFMPFWMIGDGQEEDVYSEEVKKSTRKRSYKVYDNEVIETSDNSTVYPYDKTTLDLDRGIDDGISSTPTVIKGSALIYHDISSSSDSLQYTYTRAGDPTNYFSFEGSIPFKQRTFDKIAHDGGMGATIAEAKQDVEDQYNSFAASVSDWERVEEYSAVKHEDGSFSVNFTGDLCMPLYSAEWLWGCEFDKNDEDYEHPLAKTTFDYDNVYVDRRIRTHYRFEISKDAILTYGECTYLSYHTQVYYDPGKKYNFLNGNLIYPLTSAMVKDLRTRLVEPDYFQGEPNRYKDPSYLYDKRLPYNVDYFTGSNAKNGDYDLSTLPNKDLYRGITSRVDVGAWINAYDLLIDN